MEENKEETIPETEPMLEGDFGVQRDTMNPLT